MCQFPPSGSTNNWRACGTAEESKHYNPLRSFSNAPKGHLRSSLDQTRLD